MRLYSSFFVVILWFDKCFKKLFSLNVIELKNNVILEKITIDNK